MKVLAHRGYHALARENTLAAFEAAQRLGVDGIETDVRLSADGKVVILHDRVTPAGRVVSSLTHREIEADCGHAVPLLIEILDAMPSVLWNLEIKQAEAASADAALKKAMLNENNVFLETRSSSSSPHPARSQDLPRSRRPSMVLVCVWCFCASCLYLRDSVHVCMCVRACV